MNPTECARDPRSEQLDHMIRDACRMLQEEIANFSPKVELCWEKAGVQL